jgi:hypothetical protein
MSPITIALCWTAAALAFTAILVMVLPERLF